MSRLVFDIGGTNMRMAIAESSSLQAVKKVATPKDPEEAVTMLAEFAAESIVRPIDCVGGIAGIIRKGVVVDSPNLPSWNGFSFAEELTKETGLAARIYNDAEIAAYGEAKAGAGRGYERVAYLTIGTGVGGAYIEHATLPPESQEYEPGRQLIAETGKTLEDFVGGAALEREFGTAPEHLPRSLFTERTHTLALGILHIITLWSPDVIVLNGALMNEETAFRLEDVKEALDVHTIPVVRSVLGDESALHGAALA
ncbi:MAG: ROK family protein [Patescibacteria group bacterium]